MAVPIAGDPEAAAYLQTIFGNAALMREFAEAQSWSDQEKAEWHANMGNYPFVMTRGTTPPEPPPEPEPPPQEPQPENIGPR